VPPDPGIPRGSDPAASPEIAAAVAELAAIADADVEAHPERYRTVHGRLQAALDQAALDPAEPSVEERS
jgi:hypothetical protein